MNTLLEQPARVQRKRSKGFKLPPMTKCVTRGTPWGNPFYVGPAKTPGDPFACETNEIAVEKYTAQVQGDAVLKNLIRTWLRGWNLACYCAPGRRAMPISC
jgi:hypothetical protein